MKKGKKTLLGLCMVVFALGLSAQGITWEEILGIEARDIAIGGSGAANDDVVYAIGKNDVNVNYGGYIYRWNESSQVWQQLGGLADSVSVSPSGVPWVVNNEGKIYELLNSGWKERHGYNQSMRANDIGIGHNGTVMIISRIDGHIYRWNGYKWVKVCNFAQGADRIDVDYLGNPWVVNSCDFIFQYLNGQWICMTLGQNIWAWDIGSDCNGWEVWIPRADEYQTPEGGPLYYAMAGGDYWYGPADPNEGMKCVRVDLSDGKIWTVTASGKVWKGTMW